MSATETPTPAALPRPGLRPARKRDSIVKQLWSDLPLIALAAVLSAYIWSSLRKEVLVTGDAGEIVNIRVHPNTGSQSDLRVGPIGTLSLRFEATKGIFERIRADLTESGIQLVVGNAPAEERGFSYERGDRYVFDWAAYLQDPDHPIPMPTGTITRLKSWVVPIEAPAVPDLSAEKITVQVVDVAPDERRFLGPATLWRGGEPEIIQPDPIRLAALRLGNGAEPTFDTTLELPLGFDTWRRRGNADSAAAVDPDRAAVQLSDVIARVRLRRTGEAQLTNELRIAATIADLDAFTFEILDITDVNAGPGGANVTATLIGTAKELATFAQNMDQWYFELDIPPEERRDLAELGDDRTSVEVRARLSLVLRGKLAETHADVRLEPTKAQRERFFLSVRKRGQ